MYPISQLTWCRFTQTHQHTSLIAITLVWAFTGGSQHWPAQALGLEGFLAVRLCSALASRQWLDVAAAAAAAGGEGKGWAGHNWMPRARWLCASQ
jgi:hypothetical protein